MTKKNQNVGDLAIEAKLKKGRKSPIKGTIPPERVRELAGYGLNQAQAAAVLGCSVHHISRHYKDVWNEGLHTATAKVAESLFKIATGDGPTAMAACAFWLKCKAAWSEKQVLEVTEVPADLDQVKRRYAELIERRARELVRKGEVQLPAPVETNAQPVPPATTMGVPVELNPARSKAKVF